VLGGRGNVVFSAVGRRAGLSILIGGQAILGENKAGG